MRKFSVLALGMSLFVTGAALPSFAQTQPGQGAGAGAAGGNGGGRRGNFDPAQARQRMEDAIKGQLGASDEEWTALQPRLDKVLAAQRDTRSAGGFGRGGGGRRGGNNADPAATPAAAPADATQQSEVAKAQAELKTALDNKDTPAADLAAKLKTLRDAKEKAKGTLSQAQKELKELLTQRQEAVLVNMGVLE